MPRRALLLITIAVLALHWLALGGMPVGGTDEGSAERIAFHTRMVTPPPPTPEPVSEPEAAPSAAKPAQPAAPKPRPRPRPAVPRKAPPPDAEATPEPIHEAQEAPDNAPQIEPLEPSTAHQEAASAPERIAPEPMPSASDASPAMPAPAAASAASAPASPDDELSAGVDIRPPGAAGAHASTEPPPIRLPASVTLHYAVHGEVKKMAYNVSGQLQWKNEGSGYEASQEVSAFLLGTRSQKSTGAITPNGLAPVRFGDKGRKEVAAHFDFDQRVVTYSANTPPSAISAGAQDRVSVLIQLGAMMAAAPDRYPPGTQITFTTVGPRNADRWTFTVGERETLELPAGPTPAIRLQKLPRHDRDLRADLWLGIDRQYLPVRLRLTQSNGDFAELALK